MTKPTHLNLGNAAYRQGDYVRAIEHYEQARRESEFVRRLVEPNLLRAREKQKANRTGDALEPRFSTGVREQGLPAVAVHAYYPEFFEDILTRLAKLGQPFGLFVSAAPEHRPWVEQGCARYVPWAHIVTCPNVGFDIGSIWVSGSF